MHEPHRHPQTSESITSSGEDQHHYRQHSSGCEGVQGTSVPFQWHGSNRKSGNLLRVGYASADDDSYPLRRRSLLRQQFAGSLEFLALRGIHLEISNTKIFQRFHNRRRNREMGKPFVIGG